MRDPFLFWIMHYTKTPFSWVILVGFCAAYINMWSDYLRLIPLTQVMVTAGAADPLASADGR